MANSKESTSKAAIKFSLENDKRDIKDLWNDALKDYKSTLGRNLQSTFRSTEDMIQYAVNQEDTFHKWRHDGRKLDKIRSLFMQNIGFIESGAQKLVAAATPAFPPAAAIGTALTFVLAACKGQSADYDAVMSFFEDMNNFLHRITILEGRLPAHRAYQACLMDVFTALLNLCALATKFISKGRFKTWIINSFVGQDADLSSARQRMDKNIDRLRDATELAVLANTEGLKGGVQGLLIMQEELETNQTKQNALIEEQTRLLDKIQQSQMDVQDSMEEMKESMQVMVAIMKPKKDVPTTSADALDSESSNPVRTFVSMVARWFEPPLKNLRETRVAGTGTWLFQNSTWKSWSATSGGSLLLLKGPLGIGKSHLAAVAYDHLYEAARQNPVGHSIVTYFFCDANLGGMLTFRNFLCTIVLQISEQNPVLQDQFGQKFASKRESDPRRLGLEENEYLKELVYPSFGEDSEFQLCIVIDGVDDFHSEGQFTDMLESITQLRLRIKIIRTMRHTSSDILGCYSSLELSEPFKVWELNIGKENVLPDVKMLIHQRMQTKDEIYVNLMHLDAETRRKITAHVEKNASTLLYVDFALRYLSSIRREGAILRELGKGLATETSGLFGRILTSCKRRLPQNLTTSVQSLLIWLTYAFDSLDLDQANQIVSFTSQDEEIRLEEEIEHIFGRVLQIGPERKQYRPDNDVDESSSSSEEISYDDGDLVVELRDPCMKEFLLNMNINRWDEPEHRSSSHGDSSSHRSIFLYCCHLMGSDQASNKDPTLQAGSAKLKQYALKYCLRHWQNIDCDEHEFYENMEVCDAFHKVLTDRYGYFVGKLNHLLGRSLSSAVRKFDDMSTKDAFETFSQVWQRWAKLVENTTIESARPLHPAAHAYWKGSYEDAFQPLFEAVMENWLEGSSQREQELVYATYITAWSILPYTKRYYQVGLTPEQCMKYIYEPTPVFPVYKVKTVYSVRTLYHRPLTSAAYFATAQVFQIVNAFDDAHDELTLAMENCHNAVQKAQISIGLSQTCQRLGTVDDNLSENDTIALERKNLEQALIHLNLAIELSPDKASQSRICALYQRIPVLQRLNEITGAGSVDKDIIESFQQIRPYSLRPLVNRENLIFKEVLYYGQDNSRIMDFVVALPPAQTLTLFLFPVGYDNYGLNKILLPAAMHTKRLSQLQSVYYGILNSLNLQNNGIMWYSLLIRFHRAIGDLESLSQLLGKVLAYSFDFPSIFIGDTLFEAQEVAEDYINLASDVFYQQFRASNKSDTKIFILQEAESVPLKPMCRSVQISTTSFVPHLTVLAQMQRKIGSFQKYQESLQRAFDICWANLHDDIVSNDMTNLRQLAKVLMIAPSLIREAEIVISAQLYYCGKLEKPSRNQTPSESGDDDLAEEDLEYSTFSHLKEIGSLEDGPGSPECTRAPKVDDCPEETSWCDWNEPMYTCLCCTDSILCQSCYDERIRRNGLDEVKDMIDFCCNGGLYLKAPMEGWQGIRDGIIYIENEEPIEFETFLEQLREKWKQAWDDFWKG